MDVPQALLYYTVPVYYIIFLADHRQKRAFVRVQYASERTAPCDLLLRAPTPLQGHATDNTTHSLLRLAFTTSIHAQLDAQSQVVGPKIDVRDRSKIGTLPSRLPRHTRPTRGSGISRAPHAAHVCS